MREIKFRGISVINGKFVYGYFVKTKYRRNSPILYHWIHTPHPKDYGKPSTITMIETNSAKQYTGLKDKNGVEIYEGDRVNIDRFNNGWEEPYTIKWDNLYLAWCFNQVKDTNIHYYLEDLKVKNIKVIGNIHDKS